MSKIFGFLSVLILTIGLVGFTFSLSSEYDFLAQLSIVSNLPFSDPISDIKEIILEIQNIWTFEGADLAWYEYLVRFFDYLGHVIMVPLVVIKDVAQNLYFGLLSVLVILGFTY